jgi:hypothetical protein
MFLLLINFFEFQSSQIEIKNHQLYFQKFSILMMGQNSFYVEGLRLTRHTSGRLVILNQIGDVHSVSLPLRNRLLLKEQRFQGFDSIVCFFGWSTSKGRGAVSNTLNIS